MLSTFEDEEEHSCFLLFLIIVVVLTLSLLSSSPEVQHHIVLQRMRRNFHSSWSHFYLLNNYVIIFESLLLSHSVNRKKKTIVVVVVVALKSNVVLRPCRHKRRMNTDGRERHTVTGSGFTMTTMATTSEQTPATSSSALTWHSSSLTQVCHHQPTSTYDHLRLRSTAAAVGSSSIFRLPVTPPDQSSRIFSYDPIVSYGSLLSQFALPSPPTFYSRLTRQPQPIYSPGMTVLQQQQYLQPTESYAQSLIQISQLPHLMHHHQPHQPLQYPSYLGSLASYGADGRHLLSHQSSPHQRMTPSSSGSTIDPFLRSHQMQPESSHSSSSRRSSPASHQHKDDRLSSSYPFPTLHALSPPQRCGVPRTVVHFAPALPTMPHHHMFQKSMTSVAESTATPVCRMSTKEQAGGVSSSGMTVVKGSTSSTRSLTESPGHHHHHHYLLPPPPTCSSSTMSHSPSSTPLLSTERQQPHYPPHFMRGSIIQLGDGRLKRVEDLETTDFIESAGNSEKLEIDSSTVVHMRQNHERNTVILGFSVGQLNIQVTVEATLEHPFFVYNQGWSSYSPERTLERYGLPCHQLMVGNQCISLTQRDPSSPHQTSRPTQIIESGSQVSRVVQSRSLQPPNKISHALGAPEEMTMTIETTSVTDVEERRRGGGGVKERLSCDTKKSTTMLRHSHDEQSSQTHEIKFPLPSGIKTHSVISSLLVKAAGTKELEQCHHHHHHHQTQLAQPSILSPDRPNSATASLRSRKRRWSAPDVFPGNDEVHQSTMTSPRSPSTSASATAAVAAAAADVTSLMPTSSSSCDS